MIGRGEEWPWAVPPAPEPAEGTVDWWRAAGCGAVVVGNVVGWALVVWAVAVVVRAVTS